MVFNFSNMIIDKKQLIIYSIVFFILILIIIIVIKIITTRKTENFIDINITKKKTISWNQNKCFFNMNETMVDILKKHGIKRDTQNWDLFLPCGYDEINKEIDEFPIKDGAKYFIVGNADEMVAKEYLWKNIVAYHGMKKALTMMPMSYILYDDADIKRFDIEYDANKIYIMKKNIQRQEGLKITKDKHEILTGIKNGYVVVQELLQDPYIIDGRKTNMRFYVLVVVLEKNIDVYVFNDGFMYYTKDKFVKNSLETGPNITTGYIERSVYEKNPLTHKDLRIYLDNKEQKLDVESMSNTVFNKIYKLLSEVFVSFSGKINADKISHNVAFQLFGIDICFNDKFEPMIMEINKGPDMGAKDKRDSELKHNVMEDLFAIVGLINQKDIKRKNGFIKILEV